MKTSSYRPLLAGMLLFTACSAPKNAQDSPAQAANRQKVAAAMDNGQIPSYPGGLEALMGFLSKNVKYPKPAYDDGIDGTVIVQFVVKEDGNIISPEIISSYLGGGLEQEALRVVQKMPRWEPGYKDGKPVSATYKLPIRFTLPPHKKNG